MEEALAAGLSYRVNHKVHNDKSRQSSQTLHSGRVRGQSCHSKSVYDLYLKVLTQTDCCDLPLTFSVVISCLFTVSFSTNSV